MTNLTKFPCIAYNGQSLLLCWYFLMSSPEPLLIENMLMCPPWEFRTNPKKGFFDFGGVAGVNYEVLSKQKSSFEVRLAYRLYNDGISPISLGFFYNRHL